MPYTNTIKQIRTWQGVSSKRKRFEMILDFDDKHFRVNTSPFITDLESIKKRAVLPIANEISACYVAVFPSPVLRGQMVCVSFVLWRKERAKEGEDELAESPWQPLYRRPLSHLNRWTAATAEREKNEPLPSKSLFDFLSFDFFFFPSSAIVAINGLVDSRAPLGRQTKSHTYTQHGAEQRWFPD